MGELSIYHIVFALVAILPFLTLRFKSSKTGLITHFIGWYVFGYLGFVASVAIGSSIDSKKAQLATPVSHQIQVKEKGVELI